MLDTAGAAVVLILVFTGGALLVTRTSVKTIAQQTGGFRPRWRPLGRAAKRGSPTSRRSAANVRPMLPPGAVARSLAGEASELAPGLYDFAAEGDDLGGGELPPPKKRRARKPKVDTGSQPTARLSATVSRSASGCCRR